MQIHAEKKVSLWLKSVFVSLLLMICIGGITRLTGSGLSIVEWKPVTGVLPPIGELAWELEFIKYQQTPEFKLKNFDMTLPEFKKIFFWEYIHRLWGRLIGFIILIPAFLLWKQGVFSYWLRRRITFILALTLVQGGMGWFMVKSGLLSDPHVSHYRLAMHFLLALWILSAIVWTDFQVQYDLKEGKPRWSFFKFPLKIQIISFLFFMQLCYGAFLAGTKAGFAYSTFPTMNGEWFPQGALDLMPRWLNFFGNGIFIHWFHRFMGLILILFAWGIWAQERKKVFLHFAILMSLQFSLGVLTVIFHVPVSIGVIHQVVAVFVLYQILKVQFASMKV